MVVEYTVMLGDNCTARQGGLVFGPSDNNIVSSFLFYALDFQPQRSPRCWRHG